MSFKRAQQEFKDKLGYLIKEFLMEDVENIIEGVQESKEEIREAVNRGLKKVGFWSDLCEHPILRKGVDWGGVGREIKRKGTYKKVIKVLEEIRQKKSASVTQTFELRRLLKDLRYQIIDFVTTRAGETKKGLRHFHAPGSVTYVEARNTYFGEEYTAEILYGMALRLAASVCLGEQVGVYFEGAQKELEQFSQQRFGSKWAIPPREIGISKYEMTKPYLTLMKFLLWLWCQIPIEKESPHKELLQNLIQQIKQSSAVLYFTPGADKVRWRMITVPRLDFFTMRWLESEERRKEIEQLMEGLTRLVNHVSQKVQEKKAENTIELLMTNYEVLSRRLFEFGTSEYYALRNIVNLTIELSVRYDIPETLTYMKGLI